MHLVDQLNFRENGKIKFGGQDLRRTCKIKQEKLSNRFSTRLNEIIKVKNSEIYYHQKNNASLPLQLATIETIA
ncbi:DUF4113 domain-containing protein [Christiangramia echinicola]|uniref:DUF4113 domain-containing protein n=1 Tax=Christiangramia echinicola TaxID=279359 RepID=UPI0006882FA3